MKHLAGREMVAAEELAKILGTSRRTVYRYVEELKGQGLAVEACPGSKGGFRLSQNNPNLTRALNENELLSLMLAGLAVAEHNLLPNNDSLEAGLNKIRDSLDPQTWAQIQEKLPNISLMVGKLYEDDEVASRIEAISAAIHGHQTLHTTYSSFSSNRTETRLIDPYHLLFQGGAWYVVGYCRLRKEFRTFRVDRMSDLTPNGSVFVRAPEFNLGAYLGASWGIMRGERHKVAVRFFPPISRYISEGHWHSSQTVSLEADGSVVFGATVDGLDEVKRWILSFGAAAQVIAPEALYAAVAAEHRDAAARYEYDKGN
jgi:predicted DNA-binding transcriptional regulator YafY